MAETAAPERSLGAPRLSGLREWIRNHDESWIFVVLYLGLAVGLSVFVSLFWLVVVGALHFFLELLRQGAYQKGWVSITLHALWEVKLDAGLILLALALVLYIDVVLGLLGLQSAARAAAVSRAGVRIGSRAAAWERNLRTFLLTMDEMARVGQAVVMFGRKKKGGGKAIAAAPETPPASSIPLGERPPVWRQRWKLGDRIGLGLVVVGSLFIVAAPLLTDHDISSARTLLAEELQPFPAPEAAPDGDEG